MLKRMKWELPKVRKHRLPVEKREREQRPTVTAVDSFLVKSKEVVLDKPTPAVYDPFSVLET